MPTDLPQQTHPFSVERTDAERHAAVLAGEDAKMHKLLREGTPLRCPSCDSILLAKRPGTFVCWTIACPRYYDEYTRSEIENAVELAGTRRLEEAANSDNATSPEIERAELVDAGRRVR